MRRGNGDRRRSFSEASGYSQRIVPLCGRTDGSGQRCRSCLQDPYSWVVLVKASPRMACSYCESHSHRLKSCMRLRRASISSGSCPRCLSGGGADNSANPCEPGPYTVTETAISLSWLEVCSATTRYLVCLTAWRTGKLAVCGGRCFFPRNTLHRNPLPPTSSNTSSPAPALPT